MDLARFETLVKQNPIAEDQVYLVKHEAVAATGCRGAAITQEVFGVVDLICAGRRSG
jgi:hypothetical protein